MKKYCYFLVCMTLTLLSSCGSSNFIKGEAGKTSVQIADRITYEAAFDDVVSVLFRDFEIEMINKEAGYIRTTWKTTWTAKPGQKPQKDYRVRVVINMSPTRKRIDILSEAEKLKGGYWIKGNDTRLLETIRKDIAGNVGM